MRFIPVLTLCSFMEKKLLHHFLWGQITHLGKKGHCMSEGKERFHQHRFLFQLVKGKCFFFSNSCIILYWFIYCFSQSFFREEERMLVKVVGRSLAERKDLPLSHPSPEASLPSPWRRSRFRPGTIIYNPCPSKGSRNLASRGAYPCEAYPSV